MQSKAIYYFSVYFVWKSRVLSALNACLSVSRPHHATRTSRIRRYLCSKRCDVSLLATCHEAVAIKQPASSAPSKRLQQLLGWQDLPHTLARLHWSASTAGLWIIDASTGLAAAAAGEQSRLVAGISHRSCTHCVRHTQLGSLRSLY